MPAAENAALGPCADFASVRRFVCLCALLLPGFIQVSAWGLPSGQALRSFSQQTWDSDSALGQTTVNAVFEARDGLLWVAAEGGLFRYDGAEFQRFALPGAANAAVLSLAEDSGGTLWAGSSAGLFPVRGGRVLPAVLPEAVYRVVAAGGALVVAATGNGVAVVRAGKVERRASLEGAGEKSLMTVSAERVWVAGTAELLVLDARSGGEMARVQLAPDEDLRAMVADGDQLWAGGSDGLLRFAGGVAHAVGQERCGDVLSLTRDGRGKLLAGTRSGLLGAGCAVSGVPMLAGSAPRLLYTDREGSVWAATAHGIARVGSGGQEELVQPALRGVQAMFEDREGSMWFATESSGLTVLRRQAVALLSARDGLASSRVLCGAVGADGATWIGTAAGLDRMEGEGSIHAVEGELGGTAVSALAATGGEVWVGTAHGLFLLRGGRVAGRWTAEDGLPDDAVRSVLLDRDGSVWAGTRHGLAHRAGGRFAVFSRMDGLGSDVVGSLLRSRSGVLYVATGSGLSVLRGTEFAAVAGVPAVPVTALAEDASGVLWIATRGEGVFTRDVGGRVSAVGGDALPRTVLAMQSDGAGHIWLRGEGELVRVGARAVGSLGAAPGAVMRLPLGGGSVGDEGGHPAAWLGADGSLMFATARGVASVSAAAEARNLVAPLTVIESVRVDGGEVADVSAGVVSSPGRHAITIRFGSSSFAAPGLVRFRYRMEGAESAWTEAGDRRTADYAALPPGRYRFAVMSANNDGVWGEPVAVEIRQRAWFYQTLWFYGLVLAVAAALVYFAYRWRVRYVAGEYSAVLAERTRLAREIHDTLAQGYVAVGMQLDIASRLLQADAPAATEQIAAARQLVRENLEEARSSIWNLRVQGEEGTLPARLAATAARRLPDGPEVRLDVHGTYRPVAARVEQELLRIAQEAVANARRHAGARCVRVCLTYGGELSLLVSDDGRGFDTSGAGAVERRGHFGIAGMRERADVIGATLTMESAPGQGTRVTVTLPMPADEET